jgi:hypothetical protein
VPRKEYIERLKSTIEQSHNCAARHLNTTHVTEIFKGTTLWEGSVEQFELLGHPKAKLCYGWSQGDPEEFVTILEMPAIKSANDAVRFALGHRIKKGLIMKYAFELGYSPF